MITKSEKNRIIKILGKQYSSKVQDFLNKKGIYNANGNALSLSRISHIMCGYRSNKKIEAAIFELVEITKQELQQIKNKRAQILGTKKAVALTTA